MCIMVGGTSEPSKTKLIHTPVTLNNNSYNLLIYVNNLNFNQNQDYLSMRTFNTFNTSNNNAVMVVRVRTRRLRL